MDREQVWFLIELSHEQIWVYEKQLRLNWVLEKIGPISGYERIIGYGCNVLAINGYECYYLLGVAGITQRKKKLFNACDVGSTRKGTSGDPFPIFLFRNARDLYTVLVCTL
jgi:hypothetical protein